MLINNLLIINDFCGCSSELDACPIFLTFFRQPGSLAVLEWIHLMGGKVFIIQSIYIDTYLLIQNLHLNLSFQIVFSVFITICWTVLNKIAASCYKRLRQFRASHGQLLHCWSIFPVFFLMCQTLMNEIAARHYQKITAV